MRTLAIDLGTKRIGLAISDEGGRFASPHEVLALSSADLALAPIVQLVQTEGIERIVLGLPLNMDDTLGPAAKAVIAWSKKLAAVVTVPIVFVDERLSSFEAEERLTNAKRHGAKMTRKDRKQSLDAVAAAAFLQQFLDGKLQAIRID